MDLGNNEISRIFSLYAELLTLHNKNEKLAGLLNGAAYRISRLGSPVIEMDRQELEKLFNPAIVKTIRKLQQEGLVPELEVLIELTPGGLFELMQLKGLGGRKLSILWHRLGIDNIETLLDACKKGKLRSIKGFATKTEANIIQAIEDYNNNSKRFHYASVADVAHKLVMDLQQSANTSLISLCGEIRRKTNTVAAIEIIAATDLLKLAKLKSISKLLVINSVTKDICRAHTMDEYPVIIYKTTAARFSVELFKKTGNTGHVEKVLNKTKTTTKFSTETAIYRSAGLPFIVPEMREDLAEWKFKKAGSLITAADIKGVVHNHTDWSDGIDTLEEFTMACKELGFEYTIISDHSKNAHYAGGLKEEKLLKQMAAIDKLNKTMKPFRIFKAVECDILVSGELDYNNSLLKKLDLVIISIHQQLKMDKDKATKRLIKAIENPYTTILGHMTGRKLLSRAGYPLDSKKVIDACAANKVVIEINGNPYRLDMDWSLIPYALSKSVMISVNPDAHSIAEIENIRWGVESARKGGLTKDMTWNAGTLKEVELWLMNRK